MKINKRKLFLATVYLLASMLILAFVTSLFYNHDPKAFGSSIENFAETYIVEDKEVTLPYVAKCKGKSSVTLKTITRFYTYSDSIILFKTSGMDVKIFTEDTLLYLYEGASTFAKNSNHGSKWHAIPFEHSLLGQHITFEFTQHSGSDILKIPTISHGSNHASLSYVATKSILPSVFALLTLLLGIASIFIGTILLRHHKNKAQMVYYLFFCLFATLFICTNIPITQFLFNAPHTLFKINCFAYAMTNIFSYLYFYKLIKIQKHTLFRCLLILQICFSIAVFSIINFAPFFMNITHLLYLLTVPIMWLIFWKLTNMLRCKQKFGLLYTTLATVIIVLVFANMLLESLLFFENTYIFEILIVFTFIPLTITIRRYANKANDAMQNEFFLTSVAYKDALTGISNRAKFEEDSILNDKLLHTYMVMFDINNLKIVNDTEGHKAGDKLIQKAADVISSSFALVGKAYRIGGDEFAVIIKKQSNELINIAIKDFIKACARENISIAYAINKFDSQTDTCITDLFVRVDKFMYVQKQKMKGELSATSNTV